MESTVLMLGAIGAVILIAALSSGALERVRIPPVLLFLAIGTAIGPYGLALFDFGIESETVRVAATLGLVLVLFTDAVSVAFADLRRHLGLAAIILGPGTALTAAVIAASAHFLLDLGWAQSAVLGAALASTDPVLLRGLLRSRGVPDAARQALRMESGMNDAVLLPVVLVASALLLPAGERQPWSDVLVRVVGLGGGAGVVVGLVAVGAFEFVRRRIGIRRDYESLYVIAVALTAFAAAEAVHGSGFIAAFTAGLTIAALDLDLCECFYDYGEASTEMALLFTFVLLGSSAIWLGIEEVSGPVLVFAAIALFVRGLILLAVLAPAKIDRNSLLIVAWFGPRGLSSLLLVLLPVFAGAPGAERLFALTALVVLLSVIIHGGSQMLLPTDASSHVSMPQEGVAHREKITLAEVDALVARGEPVRVLDVRSDASWRRERSQPAGAIRIPPDRSFEAIPLLGLPPDTWLVLYCT